MAAAFRVNAHFAGARVERNPDPKAHPNDRYRERLTEAFLAGWKHSPKPVNTTIR